MSKVFSSILAIDIGCGTQDIFVYQPDQSIENCPKMVLPSFINLYSKKIKQLTKERKNIFLKGNLMGGGPVSWAIKEHLKAGLKVSATPLAAKTIRDNLKEVEGFGVKITQNAPSSYEILELKDIDLDFLKDTFKRFDISWPKYITVAVQDHGYSPNLSNRIFRFKMWEEFIKNGGDLFSLAYKKIPDYLTRMKAVQRDILNAVQKRHCEESRHNVGTTKQSVANKEIAASACGGLAMTKNAFSDSSLGIILMDTCPAAVLGSLCDEKVKNMSKRGVVIINCGNHHVFAVLYKNNRVWGLFEHHTPQIDHRTLLKFIDKLRKGALSFEEINSSGGHGSYIHPKYKYNSNQFKEVVVTGPNRQLLRKAGFYEAVPFGDMMLTGCFGLVEAVKNLGSGIDNLHNNA